MFQWQSSALTSLLKKKKSKRSPNRGKSTHVFIRIVIEKIQNLFKRDGGLSDTLFWFDILTQAVTPVPKGFSRLHLCKAPKYSFFSWHIIFAHEEFWIRKPAMEALRGSVLFLTWLA